MTLASAALGCKVNQYEANKLASALAAAGFRVVPFGGRADVYLINTCCVTAESEAKSRKLIRRARRPVKPGATPQTTFPLQYGQNPTSKTRSSPCGSRPAREANVKENCCHE